MRAVSELLPLSVTEDGRKIVGNPSQGCRDCGTVIEYKSPSGFSCYYLGVECCVPALTRQIQWRGDDFSRIKKQQEDWEKAHLLPAEEAIKEAENEYSAYSGTKGQGIARGKLLEAQTRLEKIKKAYDQRLEQYFKPQLGELGNDLRRLKAKRDTLRAKS